MIINIIKKYGKYIGIDGAIGYTVLSKLIQASNGLIVIALISLFLSKTEQGYYYTFGSIVSLQIFFEFGLNSIIKQYVAHEKVHLTFDNYGRLIGSQKCISRISSILRFSVKIFGVLSFIICISLIIIGFVFFKKYGVESENIYWKNPWILLSITNSLIFFVNPFLSFLEGLGKVKQIARLKFFQQLFNIISIVLAFVTGGKLWILGISSLVSFMILALGIVFGYRKILKDLYGKQTLWKIDYWKEIFPFQWKITLSWISGYFIFQLFNPILFATEGAIVAGQMGMTLTALNGIFGLAYSWISTKVPYFSGLVSTKQYNKLDLSFNITLKHSSCVNAVLLLMFFTIVFFLQTFNYTLGTRFLSLFPFILMLIPSFLNHFVFSWATYLRCHKQEPFLILSIVSGAAISISIIIFGKYFGVLGITISYSILSFFLSFLWGYSIYIKKKKEFHTVLLCNK